MTNKIKIYKESKKNKIFDVNYKKAINYIFTEISTDKLIISQLLHFLPIKVIIFHPLLKILIEMSF